VIIPEFIGIPFLLVNLSFLPASPDDPCRAGGGGSFIFIVVLRHAIVNSPY
jgi:hypothetical protein